MLVSSLALTIEYGQMTDLCLDHTNSGVHNINNVFRSRTVNLFLHAR